MKVRHGAPAAALSYLTCRSDSATQSLELICPSMTVMRAQTASFTIKSSMSFAFLHAGGQEGTHSHRRRTRTQRHSRLASCVMSRLIGCKVYVSEGRNQAVLDALTEIARSQPLCALVQRFTDPVYHRANFTLGGEPEPVGNGALHVIEEALKRVDLSTHSDATHPRVGSVDHVSFHPLGSTRIEAARDAALRVGREVGERLKVPVLLYGVCNGIRLAEVRRKTSYFRGLQVDPSIESDFGPQAVDPSVGVMCVGAVPYVCNYNIRLKTTDRSLAARITRAVRERDGGLEKVEALTLRHDWGQWEVACNLLDVGVTPPERVLEVAKGEAAKLDVEIDAAYTVGMTAEEILDATRKLLHHDV